MAIKNIDYKKEICVSVIATLIISYALINLKKPVQNPIVKEQSLLQHYSDS